MRLTLNKRKFKQITEKVFEESVLILGGEFTKAITDPIYDWTDGAKRDIVDTGALRRSQKVIPDGRLSVLYVWSVEYSAAVHEGATLRNGAKLPARPWTKVALKRIDLEDIMGRLWRRYA